MENATNTATQAVTDAVKTSSNVMGEALNTVANPCNAPKLFTNLMGDVMNMTTNFAGGSLKTVDDLITNLPTVCGLLPELIPIPLPINALPNITQTETTAKEYYQTLPPSTLEDADLLVVSKTTT